MREWCVCVCVNNSNKALGENGERGKPEALKRMSQGLMISFFGLLG